MVLSGVASTGKMKEMYLGGNLTVNKINSEWVIAFKVKCKAPKLWDKNTRRKPLRPGPGAENF